MNKLIILIGCLTLAATQTEAAAQKEAKELFESSVKKLSLSDIHLMMELETSDGKGNSKSKSLDVKFARFEEEKKVMIEITAPEQMVGTQILYTDYPDRQNIVEIYIPSNGRIQRLRANKKNFKILDSEIPLRWFNPEESRKVSYTHLGKDTCGQTECYKIKLQQSNQTDYEIAYISTDKEQLTGVDMYNAGNQIIARTRLTNYEEIKGTGKVFPKNISARNLKTGQSSRMKVGEVTPLRRVKKRDFTLTTPGSS